MYEWDVDKDGRSEFSCDSSILKFRSYSDLPIPILIVSYQEFKEMFRTTQKSVKKEILDQNDKYEEGDDELVGLEAKIPGGKFDTPVKG
jgi:hypothetical protein